MRIMRLGRHAAVIVAFVIAAASSVVGRAGAQPPFTSAQDPSLGARVFDEKGCARCHAGAALTRIARHRTFFDLAAGLWNHAPKMAATMRAQRVTRPHLEPKEAADLAGYLFTLDYFDRKGRPAVGRRLVADKRCVACHRIGSAGGDAGPPFDQMKSIASPISLATVMWNHGPQMAEAMQQRGIERPTFKAGELVDLIAWLNRASPAPATGPVFTLPGRAAEGLRVFTEARCVECHSIGGPARAGIVDLVERTGKKSVTDFAAAMWNKAPAMQTALKARGLTVPALKPEDTADLVALLYTAQYFAGSGTVSRGVAVAAKKRCLDCHGLHGERGKPAGDLVTAKGLETPGGIVAALWNHAFIDDPRPTEARRKLQPISGDEMADLIAYLRSLRPSR